ncbi:MULTISPECIES: flagellar hook-associated protein FlgL [Marinobacter]|jgi:flagellar hook-associated protein 3 FlgL|uniref:flagellar hook-associated protein FlgL n=1 Tax=Marinobacter TaxID=2742 RepID=UPI00110A0937|nr:MULTISPECIES: flagellar hook-associated protein FlgL [Marinobacter]MCK2148963.1 flagellar hook-associated protein FlgL [Marinobacter alexandrii]
MIRISSQQVFSGGINRLQELNSNLNNTQQQISSGKRVNTPSDDPVAAARILKLDQELSRVETYQRNVNLADNRLSQEESALENSIDILQRVRELTVQAGNGALSANDRRSISSELTERLGQLADVANTRDASGEYIFSGFQGSRQAFVQDAAGSWQYQGDEGQRVLEIDDGVTVPISDHGKGIFVSIPKAITGVEAVTNSAGSYISGVELTDTDALQSAFGGAVPNDIRLTVNGAGEVVAENPNTTPATALATNPSPALVGEEFEVAGIRATVSDAAAGDEFTLAINDRQSVFNTIENLIAGLDSLGKDSAKSSAQFDTLIADSLSNLDNAQDSLLGKQTELGGRMNSVESTKKFLEDSSVYTNEIRSELQDLDYAEAISNLSFQSFVLQAAQQSFAQVSQLSLFDRL